MILRWTKKDGQKVALADMTESHIRNCMRMLERGSARDSRELNSAWGFLSMCRGDGATYSAEQMVDQLSDEVAVRELARVRWMVAFTRELRKRGLEP